MKIGKAIEAMELGSAVAREGWNGKDMYLLRASGGMFKIRGRVEGDLAPFIVMKTADGKFVPWLASHTDQLADDYRIVELPAHG